MKIRLALAIGSLVLWGACSSMYYGTMEKFGVHKRDILVDRVKEARDSQNAAGKQFKSALEQFESVVNFQGGDLEKEYNKLNATLQERVRRHGGARTHPLGRGRFRGAVQRVACGTQAVQQRRLRRSSEREYDLTLAKYQDLMAAMKRAESKLEPALAPLRDEVLFLKHNLNARASRVSVTNWPGVQMNVDTLVHEMEARRGESRRVPRRLENGVASGSLETRPKSVLTVQRRLCGSELASHAPQIGRSLRRHSGRDRTDRCSALDSPAAGLIRSRSAGCSAACNPRPRRRKAPGARRPLCQFRVINSGSWPR